MAKNKNINPLKEVDLINEVNYNEFEFKKYFKHLCNIIPNKSQEKLDIEIVDKENYNKKGLVYVFVISNKILKIGQTINAIKDRIGSYNCGKIKNRISGTASTTNYFILQSILGINKVVSTYAYFPEEPTVNVFGQNIKTNRPITKLVESEIIKKFILNHGKKPIGLTQK